LAALPAVLGVYGVLSYAVSQRTYEIGVKIALGAGEDKVMKSVLFRGLSMAIVGWKLGSILDFSVLES
jgi:ABC-type antimicrobial peptide transport system permease subunit